jgi:hypothetical protein
VQPSRLGEGAVRRAIRNLPLVLASILIGSSLTAAAARAQAPSVIVKVHQSSGLISPYFQLSGRPGANVSAGTLELVNPTSALIHVRLDPVDGQTTNTLGSAYAAATAAVHGPTTWVRLDQRFAAIPAHGRQFVKVALTVPASAAPGDYLTGVAVEALGQDNPTKLTKGVQIGETTRYAIGVELKLPGARHAAIHFTGAALSREPSGLAFLLGAVNNGNVILKNVHGWVRVSTGQRRVATVQIQPGTFVSSTSIQYPVLTQHEDPTPGTEYRIQARLVYAGGVASLDQTLQFSHVAAVTQQNYGGRKVPHAQPARYIGVALLLIMIVGGAAAVPFVLRRRRRPLTRAAGIALLDEYLVTQRPLSVALVTARRVSRERIALVLRPALRRTHSVCDLGREGLLIICPATSRPGAIALREEIYARLAEFRDLADLPIEVTISTAVKATTAQKLLDRVEKNRRRQSQSSGRLRAGATQPTAVIEA